MIRAERPARNFFGNPVLVLESEAGPHQLLENRLHERRHRTKPEREDYDHMVGRGDRCMCWPKNRRKGTRFELLLRAQKRKIESGEVDMHYMVPSTRRALSVSGREARQ
jgi:hypothetical protein